MKFRPKIEKINKKMSSVREQFDGFLMMKITILSCSHFFKKNCNKISELVILAKELQEAVYKKSPSLLAEIYTCNKKIVHLVFTKFLI